MNKLLIIGAGELGRQIQHYAKLQGKYLSVGFADDTKSIGTIIDGLPVMGGIEDILKLHDDNVFDFAFIAIGYKHFHFKEKIYNWVKKETNIPLATIISPMTWIDPTSKIGEGCIIYPGAIIDKETVISDNVVINIGAKVCHNTLVDKHNYIGPNATIAGYCSIGKRCLIGMNSSIKEFTQICDDAVIGASATITKTITEPGIYINVNEKLIK